MAETTGMAGPAASMRRRRRRRKRAAQVASVIAVAAVLIYGSVMIGLGISGLHHENVLAARGVSTTALVSATRGYGRDTVQIIYQAGTSTVQGTINVGNGSYHLGQPVLVVYDPQHPGVVGLAGHIGDTSSAWAEIVIGGLFVSLIPLTFLLSLFTARRRRRRAVWSALGE